MKALISPTEVIARGQFDQNMDPNLLKPYTALAEYRHLAAVNTFFGKEFYDALLADLVIYTEYDSTVTYALNAIVIYDGQYYKCTVNNTEGVEPTDTANWVAASKFTTTEYQTLWEEHLWQYLALAVQHASTFRNAYRSTSSGVVRNERDFSKPAEYSGVKAVKDELMADIEILREKMDDFLRTQKDDYPLYLGNKCGNTQKPANSIGLYLKPSKRKCWD